MFPKEQSAWRNSRVGPDPHGAELQPGAGASKQRSPPRPELSRIATTIGMAVVTSFRQGGSGQPVHDPVQDPLVPAKVVREYVLAQPAWTTRVIRATSEFRALADRWFRLLDECADANVFLSHEWLFSWWTAYRRPAQLAIVLVEDRGQLRGIAPLMVETVKRAGSPRAFCASSATAPAKRITPTLSRHAANADSWCSISWEPSARSSGTLAEFNQIPETSPTTPQICCAGSRVNAFHCHSSRSACPVRHLATTSEAVLASLPSRLRTSIRSSGRKLQQHHRLEFGLHLRLRGDWRRPWIRSSPTTPVAGKARGRRARSRIASAGEFYALLTPRLLERGWLRFFYLKLDGRPVAQQYCFVYGRHRDAASGRVRLRARVRQRRQCASFVGVRTLGRERVGGSATTSSRVHRVTN